MGEEQISLVDLKVGQAVILERVDNLVTDTDTKHKQNRKSIHDLRIDVQHVCDEVWKLKIKIAGYSAIAGVVTSLAIHYVEKLLVK